MAEKDLDTIILINEKNELKVPPLYKILLLNDDFTPMDFVVDVLKMFLQ